MCDKAILENGGMLMLIPDCYKDQYLSNKVVDNHTDALGSGSDCYTTQKICDKAARTYSFTILFVPDRVRRLKNLIVLHFLMII